MKKPKTLIFDLESSPKTAYVWGLWNQNIGINQIKDDMYILDWSAKWLDDEYVYSDSLHYHKLWDKEPQNDRIIVESAWEMFDQADIIVGHNVKRFDIATMNSRFVQLGMRPPSTFQVVDTLAIAKRRMKFTSNKLDFIAQALGVGQKVQTGGFQLWADIIENHDRKAFDLMVEYCENDVFITEEVYKILRPWDDKHPSVVIAGDLSRPRCNACGSNKIHKRGFHYTPTQTYQKYNCVTCGHNMRSRIAEKRTIEQKRNLLRSN
jgi:hypothetical protein